MMAGLVKEATEIRMSSGIAMLLAIDVDAHLRSKSLPQAKAHLLLGWPEPKGVEVQESIWTPWGRYNVQVRALRELKSENCAQQGSWLRRVWQVMAGVVLVSLPLAAITGYIVALYLFKSLASIDLMTGSSPLHFVYVVFQKWTCG